MLLSFFRALESRFEEIFCLTGLSVMATCIFAQVVLRVFFESAFHGAEEIAVYGMVTAIYLGCSLAIRERAHIRITFLVEKLPHKGQVFCIVLADLLWMAFILLLLKESITWIQLLVQFDYISPALGINQKFPQSIVPLALCLMIGRMAQVYYRWIVRDHAEGLPL
ncbi:TRAP transporter small permease [Ruegeria atlantica]|uniref:TRAP transporter small permease n=1 Tax=Ruegeria atlantica TaxID=81569 RepID=UPI00147C4C1D|nr:TRAP transporter small permease [Ruegeria atlantica]